MHCDITILTLYWSGELSPQETAQVEEHLATCETCRQELAELDAMQSMVSEMKQEAAPRDFVSDAIQAESTPKHKVITFLRKPAVTYPAFGAIAMAAAVLIVIMGPWFDRSPLVKGDMPVAVRQSTRSLYAKVNGYATKRATPRRTTNFRARAGHLAKKVLLAKKLSHRRSRNSRITR